MRYRLSALAAAAGAFLALLRLDRLLHPSGDGLPWQLAVAVAACLGAAITWACTAYRLDGRLVIAINLVAAITTASRLAAPATTWLVFPTPATVSQMMVELELARDLVRSGMAPVIPVAGLVAILVLAFWGLGSLISWGLAAGRPHLAVLAPGAAYLQFATMDRDPAGWWTWLFPAYLGASLLAVALDDRRGTGRLVVPGTGRPWPRSRPAVGAATLAASLAIAFGITSVAVGHVPAAGLLQWRVRPDVTGDFFGGIAYNPFVSIRQGLVTGSDSPVFVATVSGALPPERLFWRLMTMESFDGAQWHSADPRGSEPAALDSYEDPAQRFRGPTRSVVQEVTILGLEMGWAPAAYSPVEIHAGDPSIMRRFRVRPDGSLRLGTLTYRGMSYTVVSEIPDPDVSVLAAGPDGTPSPAFLGVPAASLPGWGAPAPAPLLLADAATYLSLPRGIDPAVADLARNRTADLVTDYEKGLALEAFFRSPGRFQYSAAIEPGHSAADLAAWLLDPSSPAYRTGYCEQFATAMAVMARQVGIPSRVVLGFTPGTVLDDGRVVVRDRDAHAWVELWLPTQGWVRFDPTPRSDAINPPAAADLPFGVSAYLEASTPDPLPAPAPALPDPAMPVPTAPSGPERADRAPGGVGSSGLLAAALAAALVAVVGAMPAAKLVRRRRRRRRLARGDISAAWEEIVARLDDLGVPPPGAATPAEVAAAVGPTMAPLAEAYGLHTYGPRRRPTADEVAEVASSLEATRRSLKARFTRWERMRAAYRRRRPRPGKAG